MFSVDKSSFLFAKAETRICRKPLSMVVGIDIVVRWECISVWKPRHRTSYRDHVKYQVLSSDLESVNSAQISHGAHAQGR
jgi:hypothetical protein